MRILLADRSNEALDARIATFWEEALTVLSRAPRGSLLSGEALAHLERVLGAAASRVAPGLGVEVDTLPAGEHRVVLTPGGGALEPLIARVIGRAPARGGLSVVRHRPPRSVDDAVADVRTRTEADLSTARARIGFSRGHLLEVVVYSPSFASAADERALDAANLLLPRLIGDELFDVWVDAIDVAPLPRGGSLRVLADGATSLESTLPLVEVLPAVEAAVRGVHAALPEAPYHTFCERAEWTLLELEPEVDGDYAAQDDVALVSTMLPEAMKCFLQGSRFSSSRFSRHGERFAYVKVDAGELSAEARHARTVELEEELNRVLVPGRVGCVVATGIGARYVYLTLALENVEHGVRLACARLKKAGAPKRAWLLFCDSGWEGEWAGAHDDSPPPPGADGAGAEPEPPGGY
jgi:hypothetical protein